MKHVTCALKEGLEISKLSTTGADFELIQEVNSFNEKEAEEDKRFQYQQRVVEHLNPACADFCEEEEEDETDADADALASNCVVGSHDTNKIIFKVSFC